ncbi:MAG: tRNA (adenosine(37)-N6)-threonylcarbamoyltransferase complex transferase subunit TsaD [Acidobacteriota bacterium]|nr:tRNA (adenosine(37)-N6)-threonylcarbamoyltransferase complex transferase subunit TsaD [Acidobacteriota bacterium]
MSESLPKPLILGIESSCDDTACALVDGEGRVRTSVVSSQLEAHRPWGGVVPEIASREHLRNWPEVSAEALERVGIELGDVDAVAATRGPGLVGSLLVGLSLGKAIAFALDRPFFAVHHMEGHLFSPFLCRNQEEARPAPERFVGLVVSGGHSLIVDVAEAGAKIATLAETRDDAMGEVFDKVGKRIGLPFPGGPEVDLLAEGGDAAAHPMTVAQCGSSLDFSFSGLKSQTLLDLDRLREQKVSTVVSDEAPDGQVLDILAGFRASAVAQILDRLARLHRQRAISILAVSGGAAANRLLRRALEEWADGAGIDLRLVPLVYSGDNAAMIAHAALLRHARGDADDPRDVDATSRLPLER